MTTQHDHINEAMDGLSSALESVVYDYTADVDSIADSVVDEARSALDDAIRSEISSRFDSIMSDLTADLTNKVDEASSELRQNIEPVTQDEETKELRRCADTMYRAVDRFLGAREKAVEAAETGHVDMLQSAANVLFGAVIGLKVAVEEYQKLGKEKPC